MQLESTVDKVEQFVWIQIAAGRQQDLDSLFSLLPPPLYITPLSQDSHFPACALPLKSLLVFYQRPFEIMRLVVVLAVLMGVSGIPDVTISPPTASGDTSAHPNSIPETADESEQVRSNPVDDCCAVVCVA